MTKNEKFFLYLGLCLCFLTGMGMLVLKSFFQVADEFGQQEHWLMSDFKMLHYIFSPLLIVSFGVLWQGHILKGIRNKKRRKRLSGFFILLAMIVLVLTGQMMLSLVSQDVSYWVGWIHLVTGVLIFAGILKHAFKKY